MKKSSSSDDSPDLVVDYLRLEGCDRLVFRTLDIVAIQVPGVALSQLVPRGVVIAALVQAMLISNIACSGGAVNPW